MSTPRRLAGLLAVAFALTAALPAAAAGPDALRAADRDAFRNRLIVIWDGLAPATLGMPGVRAVQDTARPMRSVVVARPGRAAELAATLRADPRVLAVVPDARLELADWPADAPPDDPSWPDQGNLPQIGVPDVWTTTTGDASVVVAVIDTGFDLDHPDLDGVPVVHPRNEIWNNTVVTDEQGHGTYTAGLIVAETNNGEGIAGMAPGVTLMPIKVADDSFGGISLIDVIDGVDWAREHGADIISMSLGGMLSPDQVALAQPVFTAARDAGILMVASSGNDYTALRNYPASFQGVVSVGAVDGFDVLADFSTTGRAVDIVAPGVDVTSLEADGGTVVASGTSASAPHVSAVAALVWSARPGLAVEELEAVLRTSAVDLGDPGRDVMYGDGRIDAPAALDAPVPDPLPNLEPPLPQPALTLAFIAPTEPVTQTGSTYTVLVETNHEVVLSVAVRLEWRIDAGRCRMREVVDFVELPFGPEIELTHLRQGHCYRMLVAAIDEDGNYAEALSEPIIVVDPVVPTIVQRRPGSGATGVDRDASVRIRFSEPVLAPAGTVRLRNTETGLIVRVETRWDRATNTLVLDPALRMYPRTTYRVEVTAKVQDRKGNPVGERAWEFRTGR